MAEQYLTERKELVLSIQLVDSRHLPSDLDRQLQEWLTFSRKPYIVVATKCDKLTNNQLAKSLSAITKSLPGAPVIAYSAQTSRGRDAVWSAIETAVSNFSNI
jgi:GTP-binding protein